MLKTRRFRIHRWNEGMQCWDFHGLDTGGLSSDVEDRYHRVYGGRWQAEADTDAYGVSLSVARWLELFSYMAHAADELREEDEQVRMWALIQDLRIKPPATPLKFLSADEWAFVLGTGADSRYDLPGSDRKAIERQLRDQGFDFGQVEKYRT